MPDATSMVTIHLNGHATTMTPEDAMDFAFSVLRSAIDASPPSDDDKAPQEGDFVITDPILRVRIEPGDSSDRRVAIVAEGNKRPNAWLWMEDRKAVALAHSILSLASPTPNGSH